MRCQSLTTIAASLLLAACAGDFNTGPGGDTETPDNDPGLGEDATARELFDDLHSALTAECQACHLGPGDEVSVANGPDFMGPETGTDSVYTYLLQAESIYDQTPLIHDSPGNSKLFFYGALAHSGSPGMSEELAGKMESWIIAEAEEDGITPEPEPEPEPDPEEPGEPTSIQPKTIVEALEMFASCMRYEDFVKDDFPLIARIQVNNGDERCYECHGGGESGAYLSEDSLTFYKGQRSLDESGRLQSNPGLYSFIAARPTLDGTIEIIQTKRYEIKRGNNGAHPNYNFPYEDDVDLFYQDTYARYQEALLSGVPCTPDTP